MTAYEVGTTWFVLDADTIGAVFPLFGAQSKASGALLNTEKTAIVEVGVSCKPLLGSLAPTAWLTLLGSRFDCHGVSSSH